MKLAFLSTVNFLYILEGKMTKNLKNNYEATLNEEIIEETQRQKSILELLLSKDEAGFYLRNAEAQKKKSETNPAYS